MVVTTENETKKSITYKTEKFKFRINQEKLGDFETKDNWPLNLLKRIQKTLKPTFFPAKGQDWEDACNEIFENITQYKVSDVIETA